MNNALYVAWRSGPTADGRWGPVGRLSHEPNGYRFGYTRGAMSLDGFVPFPGMPDLDVVYDSEELFPLFANRLLAPSRPEYEAFLLWGGFDREDPPDPIAILSVTEGRRRTDCLEVFPCPRPDATGCYINKFFLHGVRWMQPDAVEFINTLQPPGKLELEQERSNKFDPNALAVFALGSNNRTKIGYVPRYLAREFGALAKFCGDNATLTVERINPDAPLQQRVLCKLSTCWPDGFRPCSGEDFQPIASELSTLTA